MDRLQIALNLLAQQRNNALDAFVNTQADLTVAQEELAAAKARIAELEKAVAIIPADEVIQYPPDAPVITQKEEGEHGPEILP